MSSPNQNPDQELQALSYFKNKGDISFSSKSESEIEIISRLKREEDAHSSGIKIKEDTQSLDLKIKYYTFISATSLVFVTSSSCIYIILKSSTKNEWAETTLTIIISAFVGFICGKGKSS
jgi:hypothetical protein